MRGDAYDPAEATHPVLRARLEYLKENDIPMLQVVSELDALFAYMARNGRTTHSCFVELGCAFGATAYILSVFIRPGGKIVLVDNAKREPFVYRQKILAELAKDHDVYMIEQSTFDALDKVTTITGCHVDYMHIDADHRYDAVKWDYENYAPLIQPGGMLQFHDICSRTGDLAWTIDANRLWDELKPQHKTHEFIDTAYSDPDVPGNVGIGVVEIP